MATMMITRISNSCCPGSSSCSKTAIQILNPPNVQSPNQQTHQTPSPHQYYTLICDNTRAKLQQKHHDHLVHDAYSKMKQKREQRILISFDGTNDSHIPTKYPPVFMKPSPRHQYSRNHKDNLLYDAYCKKKKTDPRKTLSPPHKPLNFCRALLAGSAAAPRSDLAAMT